MVALVPAPAGESANIDELWSFIRARVPNAIHWHEKATKGWLRSSIRAGHAAVVGSKANGPKALAVIRPIMYERDAENFGTTDPEGAILHLDVLAFTDVPSLLSLADFAMTRFGTRPKLSFFHKGRLHLLPLQRFINKVLDRAVSFAESSGATGESSGSNPTA